MKKNSVIALSLLFIVSTIFPGCSKDESSNVTEQSSDKVLLANLQEFNDSTQYTRLRCEGFWDCLGDVLIVAGTDVAVGAGTAAAVQQYAAGAGAVTGGTGWVIVTAGAGVIGGAGASVAAARAIPSTPAPKPTTAKSSGMHVSLPVEFGGLSQVGIEHNLFVSNIYKELPTSAYYEYKNFSEKEIAILESSEMKNVYANMEALAIDYVDNGFDYKTMTSKMVTLKYTNSEVKNVLDLFLKKYITCTNFNQIKEVVDFYVNQVNESKLKYEDKLSLITGFMIALESPAQWLND